MIDLSKVSACLISKDPIYPKQVLDHLMQFPFGEIIILTNSPNSAAKEELFRKAKYDHIYYQDDDAICPVNDVVAQAEPDIITCAMKTLHINNYGKSRIALIGWGSIIPKKAIDEMVKYTDVFGTGDLYKREYDRILTFLNFPQKRLDLPIYDLPSAFTQDRYSLQPEHYTNIPKIEGMCLTLLNK